MDRDKVIKGMEMCISPNECSPDNCPYYIRTNNERRLCGDRLMTDAIALLKEQEQRIKELESMKVTATDNGTAIGILHGGMTIKKEYHQQAKEVYNIGHVDRLDL